MTLRITLAGCTGWVGRALVVAIARADDLALVAGVSRSAAGRDIGEAAGIEGLGVAVAGSIEEALRTPSDVLIDYTKPVAVKGHTLAALAAGRHVVVGTSGLTAADYDEIAAAAQGAGRGVLAAGNFSITATLMRRFALEAAAYVPDIEIIDYASPAKVDTPSGTGRELAEMLGAVRGVSTAKPVDELTGVRETRGGAIGTPRPVQVHSVRMPSYTLSCEVLLGADNERLVIRHDAGASAAPYVAGTLLAARRVSRFTGLRRGLDAVMG
jgi:4-hydroxy-tetrahydrodipicolinate reductase